MVARIENAINGAEVDVIIGGPPCQGFSNANRQHTTVISMNNRLVKEYVRAICELNPKAFVMENVKGLLSMQNGQVIRTIVEEFANAGEFGYNVAYKILKASDYGTPQNRERVILIGFRKDLNIQPTHPTPYAMDGYITVNNAISDLPQINAGEGIEGAKYSSEPTNLFQQFVRRNSNVVNNHIAMKHTPRLVERFKAQVRLLQLWSDIINTAPKAAIHLKDIVCNRGCQE